MVITPFRMLSSCNSATADVEIIVPYSHCLNLRYLRYLRSKEHHYKVVPQFDSVQLVQIAPISLGFMVDISVFTMAYGLSTNFELGGHHLVGSFLEITTEITTETVPNLLGIA
jgi:hypothetical protein